MQKPDPHATAAALCLALGAALCLPGPLTAAEESTADAPAKKEPLPPARAKYLGRRVAQTMHYLGAPWLTRGSREREEGTKTLLKELRLKPGMVVCDMGCGNGFYALQMAAQVQPGGRVLGVDIQKQMLKFMMERAKKENLTNIEPILGTLVDPKLPKGKLDLVLLVDVYHEFSHPVLMLARIRESLKPDGVIALAEFRLEDPKVPIKLLHKMSKKQINAEFTANGFKLAREFDELPWQHLMFFKRDPKWKPEKSGD